MSAQHKWRCRVAFQFPSTVDYDVDITDGQWGQLCTCTECGLRVIASDALMPDEVDGLPECRPLTVRIHGMTEEALADPQVLEEALADLRIDEARQQQNMAERMLLAVEVASRALGMPEGAALPADVAVALSQLSVFAARMMSLSAFDVEWGPRQRAMTHMALELLEWWTQAVAADEVNWGPADDLDEEAWKEWDDRLHPESMAATVREIRRRSGESIAAAGVMES